MERHYIQQNILKELLTSHESTFTELNTLGITNDHFTFHIKQLIKEGLIEKNEGRYALTAKGMEQAGRLDIANGNLINQPKISITLGVFRNNDSEVLLLKRKRSQSAGQYAWLDKKWRFGQSVEEGIKVLLEEEAGLSANTFIFAGATHVIRKNNTAIEIDVVLLNFKIQDPKGELKMESKDGENTWIRVDEAKALPANDKLVGFDERLQAYLDNRVIFQEFVSVV